MQSKAEAKSAKGGVVLETYVELLEYNSTLRHARQPALGIHYLAIQIG